MKLSIVIPVFNEGQTIRVVLDHIRRVELPQGIGKNIIVVDDGSTDQTSNLLAEQQTAFPLKVIQLPFNQGKNTKRERANKCKQTG